MVGAWAKYAARLHLYWMAIFQLCYAEGPWRRMGASRIFNAARFVRADMGVRIPLRANTAGHYFLSAVNF